MGLPMWFSGKESTCQCRRHRRCRFDPWVRKIPWRRKWQHIPVFLPRESHGQRSLVGYSPWGHKESDMTEWLHFLSFHFTPGLGGSVVKNQPAVQETQEMWVGSLGQEDPLEERMASHFCILVWRILWTGEPGRLQCIVSELDTTEAT